MQINAHRFALNEIACNVQIIRIFTIIDDTVTINNSNGIGKIIRRIPNTNVVIKKLKMA